MQDRIAQQAELRALSEKAEKEAAEAEAAEAAVRAAAATTVPLYSRQGDDDYL